MEKIQSNLRIGQKVDSESVCAAELPFRQAEDYRK